MSSRTTRFELLALAERLVTALGREYGTKPGQISLDHHTHPSGYRLVENLEHGGESTTRFGDRLRTAREMADAMRFALLCLDGSER